MKRANKGSADDLKPQYDFSHAVRNPYAKTIKPNSRTIVLEADVAHVFTTSAQIESALGYLRDYARAHAPSELIGRTAVGESGELYGTPTKNPQVDLAAAKSGDVLAVMVSPDILEIFPTAHAINEALRTMIYLSVHARKATV